MVSEKWVWAYIPYVAPAFLTVGWAKDRARVFCLKSRVLWAHFHHGLWGQRHVSLSISAKGKAKVFVLLLKTNPSYPQILYLTLFSLIFFFLSPKDLNTVWASFVWLQVSLWQGRRTSRFWGSWWNIQKTWIFYWCCFCSHDSGNVMTQI